MKTTKQIIFAATMGLSAAIAVAAAVSPAQAGAGEHSPNWTAANDPTTFKGHGFKFVRKDGKIYKCGYWSADYECRYSHKWSANKTSGDYAKGYTY